MKLMLDLIVLAFRMDKTRIVTCMLNNDLRNELRFLPGVEAYLDLTQDGSQSARRVSENEPISCRAVRASS